MVDWQAMFDELNIPYRTSGPSTNRGNIYVACPFCEPETSPEPDTPYGDNFLLGISLSKQAWGCWKNAEHRGRNLEYLVQHLARCDRAQAQILLKHYQTVDGLSMKDIGTWNDANGTFRSLVENALTVSEQDMGLSETGPLFIEKLVQSGEVFRDLVDYVNDFVDYLKARFSEEVVADYFDTLIDSYQISYDFRKHDLSSYVAYKCTLQGRAIPHNVLILFPKLYYTIPQGIRNFDFQSRSELVKAYTINQSFLNRIIFMVSDYHKQSERFIPCSFVGRNIESGEPRYKAASKSYAQKITNFLLHHGTIKESIVRNNASRFYKVMIVCEGPFDALAVSLAAHRWLMSPDTRRNDKKIPFYIAPTCLFGSYLSDNQEALMHAWLKSGGIIYLIPDRGAENVMRNIKLTRFADYGNFVQRFDIPKEHPQCKDFSEFFHTAPDVAARFLGQLFFTAANTPR